MAAAMGMATGEAITAVVMTKRFGFPALTLLKLFVLPAFVGSRGSSCCLPANLAGARVEMPAS